MPLSAICPNCNVANDPTAVQCSICRTALGAVLIADAKVGFRWFTISAFVSLAIFLLSMILGLHTALTAIVAVFYGPLLASYFARSNVVWPSALGGMTTLLFVLFVALVVGSHTARAAISHLQGGDTEDLVKGVKLAQGMVVALFVALPVALTGASVGEHLSVRRRRKPTALGDA